MWFASSVKFNINFRITLQAIALPPSPVFPQQSLHSSSSLFLTYAIHVLTSGPLHFLFPVPWIFFLRYSHGLFTVSGLKYHSRPFFKFLTQIVPSELYPHIPLYSSVILPSLPYMYLLIRFYLPNLDFSVVIAEAFVCYVPCCVHSLWNSAWHHYTACNNNSVSQMFTRADEK